MSRKLGIEILGVVSSSAIAASGFSKLILGELAGASTATQRITWFIVFAIGLAVGLAAVYRRWRSAL